MKKKNILALVAISVTVISIFAPLIPTISASHGTDPLDWYLSVQGTLDDDYYELYPFQKESLNIGLSKFGELIDPTDEEPNFARGLNYSRVRDPFANEGIPSQYWLQGWFADIKYVHRVYGARNVWAMATFADLVESGNDWLNGHTDPYGAPHGGRKTSGEATTEDLTVLYDGPRRFVALCRNHINDVILGQSFPLLDVTFTIIFEKVKKEVIILKDVKLTIDQKILETPVDVQFSNRAEWDLGPSPDWKSYAHFYHQEMPTCYGSDWTLAKTILREYRHHDLAFSGDYVNLDTETDSEGDPYYDVPVVLRSEYVYINGEWLTPDTDYTIDYDTGEIDFADTYPSNTELEVFFKLYKHVEGEGWEILETPHLYDVAQIISRDQQYVGWAAYWPVLSDYSVDAWDRALEPLYAVDEEDMLPVGVGEPDIPFVVGEWDFMLDLDTATTEWGEQFRGVSVYGVTDYHDGLDAQMPTTSSNVIDREVQYQLDEVFVPWGLLDAVHKPYRAWVEWKTGSGTTWTSAHRPVVDVSDVEWNQYAVFSERVVDYSASTPTLLNRYNDDYDLTVDSDGFAHITGLTSGRTYKIIYHTLPNITDTYDSGYVVLFNQTVQNLSDLNPGDVTFQTSWDDNIGVDYTYRIDMDTMNVQTINNDQNWTASIEDLFPWDEYDFKVFLNETYLGNYYDYYVGTQVENLTVGANAAVRWDPDDVIKTVSATEDPTVIWPLPDETVHIKELELQGAIRLTVTNYYNVSTETSNLTVTVEGRLQAAWWSMLMGRYEWTTVGRDAASVDAAGAALVTAAFKNKQVEIGMAGADKFDSVIQNQMPWTMSALDGDYLDAEGRSALRDDWSRAGIIPGDEWPIADSNVIGVGGPLANLLAYYGNDYTNAFYGLTQYAHPAWNDDIIALTCWDKNTYQSSAMTGYAVISSYLDINGTVLFLVWGHWGRDTFYATKWFHEEGVYQLQAAPSHLTDIILKISYQDTTEGYKPADVSIVESLGTISETKWVHGSEIKGDIHPDPPFEG